MKTGNCLSITLGEALNIWQNAREEAIDRYFDASTTRVRKSYTKVSRIKQHEEIERSQASVYEVQ